MVYLLLFAPRTNAFSCVQPAVCMRATRMLLPALMTHARRPFRMQVVSGLVKYIPEAAMQGRRVVVLCNLKPANMRGVQSQAMVLAASSADGETVELVEPPAGCKPGERLTFEGFPGEPDEQLNPKKRVFEAVQLELRVDEGLVARYKGVAFMTSLGPCRVTSVVGGSIK